MKMCFPAGERGRKTEWNYETMINFSNCVKKSSFLVHRMNYNLIRQFLIVTFNEIFCKLSLFLFYGTPAKYIASGNSWWLLWPKCWLETEFDYRFRLRFSLLIQLILSKCAHQQCLIFAVAFVVRNSCVSKIQKKISKTSKNQIHKNNWSRLGTLWIVMESESKRAKFCQPRRRVKFKAGSEVPNHSLVYYIFWRREKIWR